MEVFQLTGFSMSEWSKDLPGFKTPQYRGVENWFEKTGMNFLEELTKGLKRCENGWVDEVELFLQWVLMND